MGENVKTYSDFFDETIDYQDNPMLGAYSVLNMLEEISGGEYQITSANNPWMFLLEGAAFLAGNSLTENKIQHIKSHPHLARTYDDLFFNMSGKDFLHAFAKPADAEVLVLMELANVRRAAKHAMTGMSKIVIPKDTRITVGDLQYTMVYPIEIRLYDIGTVRVVPDMSQVTDRFPNLSADLQWSIVPMQDQLTSGRVVEMLAITIPVKQMHIKTILEKPNEGAGFDRMYTFPNKLMGIDVYARDGKEWYPVHTVYDNNYRSDEFTVQIKRGQNNFNVNIPRIFYTKDIVPNDLRIDVYTTHGKITSDMTRYHPDAYEIEWINNADPENQYTSITKDLTSVRAMSTTKVDGGHDGLSINEMMNRVVENSSAPVEVPIASSQLRRTLDREGFRLNMRDDGVSNRTYLATKDIAPPKDTRRISPIGTTPYVVKIKPDGVMSGKYIRRHTDSVTFEAGQLFESNLGILTPLNDADEHDLVVSNNEHLIREIKRRQLYMLPFHQVLRHGSDPELRTYHLDDPTTENRTFVSENHALPFNIETADIGVSKTETGYLLAIETIVNEPLVHLPNDQIHCQMALTVEGYDLPFFINGSLYGRSGNGYPIFTFEFDSDMELDADDNIIMTSLRRADVADTHRPVSLRTKARIMYLVSGLDESMNISTDIDLRKGGSFLPSNSVGIKEEAVDLVWGKRLTNLWSSAKRIVEGSIYQTYESDVYATWDEDIYETDADGAEIFDVDDNGNITGEIKYHRGNVIRHADTDEPIIKHRKGSVVQDATGRPIPITDRSLSYRTEMFFFEGLCKFLTNPRDVAYIADVKRNIVRWCEKEINPIKRRLIENTELLVLPNKTMGISFATNNGFEGTVVPLQQSLTFEMFLTAEAYKDDKIKANIRQQVMTLLKEHLTRPANVVSSKLDIDKLTVTAKQLSGGNLLDMRVYGVGGKDMNLLEVDGRDASLTIKKIPVITGEGKIAAADDITFSWKRLGK